MKQLWIAGAAALALSVAANAQAATVVEALPDGSGGIGVAGDTATIVAQHFDITSAASITGVSLFLDGAERDANGNDVMGGADFTGVFDDTYVQVWFFDDAGGPNFSIPAANQTITSGLTITPPVSGATHEVNFAITPVNLAVGRHWIAFEVKRKPGFVDPSGIGWVNSQFSPIKPHILSYSTDMDGNVDSFNGSFALGGAFGRPPQVYAFRLTGTGSGSIASAIPEPSTWMLMILGFGLIAQQLRRRHLAAA